MGINVSDKASAFYKWLTTKGLSHQEAAYRCEEMNTICKYQADYNAKHILWDMPLAQGKCRYEINKLLNDPAFQQYFVSSIASITNTFDYYEAFQNDLIARRKQIEEENQNPYYSVCTRMTKGGAAPASCISHKKYSTSNNMQFKRLERQLQKEFDYHFYLGDIRIKDAEYQELCKFTAFQMESVSISNHLIADSPLIALTLVQIGIRLYDGRYWPHVSEALGLEISQQHQAFLGKTFISTLKKHNKYILSESDRVQSILLHCFVTDYYAKGLFELLYTYFKEDLERDINRNTSDQMNQFLDTLHDVSEMTDDQVDDFNNAFNQTNNQTKSQSYKLRKHTLYAISANPGQSKMRLRRLIRMIDQYFWKGRLPKNPVSRFSVRFKEWVQDSELLRKEYRLRESGSIHHGTKHFSTPYLKASFQNNTFRLYFPMQLLPKSGLDSALWRICFTDGTQLESHVDVFPAVSCYKTEHSSIPLTAQQLFTLSNCTLLYGDFTRNFPLSAHNATRLFDSDGDACEKLVSGDMTAYTPTETSLISSALLDQENLGPITRWDFSFEEGDILIYPNRDSRIVGETFSEGLTSRQLVKNAHCSVGDSDNLPIYKEIPSLLLVIDSHYIEGTAIYINDRRYRLGDCSYETFRSHDNHGKNALMLSLNQFPIKPMQKNNIVVELPSAVFARSVGSFVYIPDFSFEFEDAPYIYTSKGIVTFSQDWGLLPESIELIAEAAHPTSYRFNTEASGDTLHFFNPASQLHLYLDVPIFCWSTDKTNWHYDQMGDCWWSDFPEKLYFKSPIEPVKLCPDIVLDDQDGEAEQVDAVFKKSSSDQLFSAELRSWQDLFSQDLPKCSVTLQLGRKEYPFALVYTKSRISYSTLQINEKADGIVFRSNVIGKNTYYLDIIYTKTKEVLVEKACFDGRFFALECLVRSGTYHVEIFEYDSEYDKIFGIEPTSLRSEDIELVNPYNLSGKCINLLYATKNDCSYRAFPKRYPFDHTQWIENLEQIDSNRYRGTLICADDTAQEDALAVQLVFPDVLHPDTFTLQMIDEYGDLCELLYDDHKFLVAEEQPHLPPRIKYRRYEALYEDEYIYHGNLCDTVTAVSV